MNIPHFYYPQRGVVLFFALLALAVMSIASVALIRGVDTNTLVTGNLVYRQSASAVASQAFESIAKTMSTVTPADNTPDKAYYKFCNTFDTTPANNTCKADKLTNTDFWKEKSKPVPATVDGSIKDDGKDNFGNTLTYVVERMCSGDYKDDGTQKLEEYCLISDSSESNNGQSLYAAQSQIMLEGSNTASPLYRITLRIEGPKHTISYLQSYYSN